MKYLFIISFIVIVLSSKAQQLPLYSQYTMNNFVLNPAIAGSEDFAPLRITSRQQWVGIEGAPITQALSYHTGLLDQHMGVGGVIFNDMFGPISRTGIQASYAYHVDLHFFDYKLGLGLSVSAFQLRLNESGLILSDPDLIDPAIQGGIETSIRPDADFGAYLYNGKSYIGVSVAQLFQFNIDVGDERNSMIRHYFITTGYKFESSNIFAFEPYLLVKYTELTPVQVDFSVKTYYLDNYWAGVSYRSDKSIVAIMGLKVEKFYIGYAFDYSFSNLSNYSNGSHEVMIGFNIGENKRKSLL